jgi:hypothetical protein
LGLIIAGNTAGSSIQAFIYAYDTGPGTAPAKLHIEYTEGEVATLEQEGYRFFDDDDTEGAASALAAQDTPISIAAETPFRPRFLLNATGDPDSIQARLEYTKLYPTVDPPASGDWSLDGPVVVPSGTGEWDEVLWMGTPGPLIKVGSTYYLYYVGAEWNDPDGEFRAIGVATGSSPGSLTKSGSNPIVTYTTTAFVEPEEGASSPVVYVDSGGTWHMWYAASRWTNPGLVDSDIRYRNSTDGITWSNDALIYQVSDDEYIPIGAFLVGGVWSLYYLGPLSAGAGALRRIYGTNPGTLSSGNELILSGSFRGSRGFNKTGLKNWLMHMLDNSWNVSSRIINEDIPGAIGSELLNYSFADHYGCAVLLESGVGWYLAHLDGSGGSDDGKIVLRTAPEDAGTPEETGWKAVGL